MGLLPSVALPLVSADIPIASLAALSLTCRPCVYVAATVFSASFARAEEVHGDTAEELLGDENNEGDDEPCSLVNMALSSNGRPVDLEPRFRPYIYSYTATLEKSMDSFSVQARPDTGCVVEGVPYDPVPVQIGGSGSLTLSAKRPTTGSLTPYTVSLERLFGSETELQMLEVAGSDMRPVFSPTTRSYHVRVGLASDVVKVMYRLRDNEQRIRSAAHEQRPSGQAMDEVPVLSSASANSSSDDNSSTTGENRTAAERLLQAVEFGGYTSLGMDPTLLEAVPRRLDGPAIPSSSGEVQYRFEYVTFMIDIGFVRTVELTIQCADPTQANIEKYSLQITRPNCEAEKPFFDPSKRFCVNFCPSGFYRNHLQHRCSKCNANCKICQDLLSCEMCEPDNAEFSYFVQPDGKCQAVTRHLFKKYKWWCAGLAVLLLSMVLVGCTGICQLLCTVGTVGRETVLGSKGASGYSQAPNESDSDEFSSTSPTRSRGKRGLGRY